MSRKDSSKLIYYFELCRNFLYLPDYSLAYFRRKFIQIYGVRIAQNDNRRVFIQKVKQHALGAHNTSGAFNDRVFLTVDFRFIDPDTVAVIIQSGFEHQ